ncbi:anaphase-promoting complex subunit 10 [Angomonas deanei]|nr:anaphase-promoting complex subunit 10 [Angomonas deanei]|eukprot:EPY19830.1 anaphase-promoting complex subunit 10 [Angomonas deanei]
MTAPTAGEPNTLILTPEALRQFLVEERLREEGISGGPVVWAVSSAKHGNGVRHVKSGDDLSTYWQSDGVLPHTLSIQFGRLTALQYIAVYLDFSQDESYTPREVKARVGTHKGDMEVVATVTVDQPQGWVMLPLRGEPSVSVGSTGGDVLRAAAEGEARAAEEKVWCTLVELLFSENHHNGRDCHIRGVRLLGPLPVDDFSRTDYTQYLLLR